jgi:Putative beta-barrel porin 2
MQTRLRSLIVSLIAFSILTLVRESATAQWLPDRAYTEGPGIRVGDLELHPGVAVRAGYDTNIFRQRTNLVGSGILAVTPHLNIKTLGGQRLLEGETGAAAQKTPIMPKVAFNAGLAGTFFYYFEDSAPANMEFDTDAVLSILPERPIGFDVSANYVRTTRPFTRYGGSSDRNYYAEDRITPGLTLRGQSRSGVLKGAITYRPLIDLFENDAFNYLNSLNHEVSGRTAWKFLPYTALLYDAGVTMRRYFDLTNPNSTVRLSDSNAFQNRLGINGNVTPFLALRALVGYAMGTYTDPVLNEYEDVVGEAAISYKVGAHGVEVGYLRSVQASSIGGWMQEDRGFLEASTLLARVFAITLRGGAGRAHYGRALDANGDPLGIDHNTGNPTDKRDDTRVDAGLHLEYRATNWFAITGDLSALVTLTDFDYPMTAPGTLPIPAQFVSYQAFGGVRFHY